MVFSHTIFLCFFGLLPSCLLCCCCNCPLVISAHWSIDLKHGAQSTQTTRTLANVCLVSFWKNNPFSCLGQTALAHQSNGASKKTSKCFFRSHDAPMFFQIIWFFFCFHHWIKFSKFPHSGTRLPGERKPMHMQWVQLKKWGEDKGLARRYSGGLQNRALLCLIIWRHQADPQHVSMSGSPNWLQSFPQNMFLAASLGEHVVCWHCAQNEMLLCCSASELLCVFFVVA